MRLCNRNVKTIYYALQTGTQPIMDEWGNETGEYKTLYTEPVAIKMNVSPARGQASTEMFGEDLNYTKSMVTTDLTCPIDEYSRLWVDKPTTESHDYIVVLVAKSINNIAYAIKKVDSISL